MNPNINSEYFSSETDAKDKRILELETKYETLEKDYKELLKSMQSLLKLESDKEITSDNIKRKITALLYREIRLGHTLPFSNLIGDYSISKFNKKR